MPSRGRPLAALDHAPILGEEDGDALSGDHVRRRCHTRASPMSTTRCSASSVLAPAARCRCGSRGDDPYTLGHGATSPCHPSRPEYTSMRSAYWVELLCRATTLPVKMTSPCFWSETADRRPPSPGWPRSWAAVPGVGAAARAVPGEVARGARARGLGLRPPDRARHEPQPQRRGCQPAGHRLALHPERRSGARPAAGGFSGLLSDLLAERRPDAALDRGDSGRPPARRAPAPARRHRSGARPPARSVQARFALASQRSSVVSSRSPSLEVSTDIAPQLDVLALLRDISALVAGDGPSSDRGSWIRMRDLSEHRLSVPSVRLGLIRLELPRSRRPSALLQLHFLIR